MVLLLDATPEACQEIQWLQLHFVNAAGEIYMSVHALVVVTPSSRKCLYKIDFIFRPKIFDHLIHIIDQITPAIVS
jgi:hypothetical protein